MSATMTFALPEGMHQSLSWLLSASINVLLQADESELARWAESVRSRFESEEVQEQFTGDIFAAADEIDGPRVEDGDWSGAPIPFFLLAEEFAAFSRRPQVAEPEYTDVDHSLDLGEILLDSLGGLLQGHPFSAALVSLIKEIVKMAKSVGKRLK